MIFSDTNFKSIAFWNEILLFYHLKLDLIKGMIYRLPHLLFCQRIMQTVM